MCSLAGVGDERRRGCRSSGCGLLGRSVLVRSGVSLMLRFHRVPMPGVPRRPLFDPTEPGIDHCVNRRMRLSCRGRRDARANRIAIRSATRSATPAVRYRPGDRRGPQGTRYQHVFAYSHSRSTPLTKPISESRQVESPGKVVGAVHWPRILFVKVTFF